MLDVLSPLMWQQSLVPAVEICSVCGCRFPTSERSLAQTRVSLSEDKPHGLAAAERWQEQHVGPIYLSLSS